MMSYDKEVKEFILGLIVMPFVAVYYGIKWVYKKIFG